MKKFEKKIGDFLLGNSTRVIYLFMCLRLIEALFFTQSKPLFSVEPGAGYLFRVRWSPSRPLVFSVVTADGRLLIYDLKVSVN